jgi:hypothetical protein
MNWSGSEYRLCRFGTPFSHSSQRSINETITERIFYIELSQFQIPIDLSNAMRLETVCIHGLRSLLISQQIQLLYQPTLGEKALQE